MQLLGVTAGLVVAPVATPVLIWATIAVNLPLTPVIMQLVGIAVFSNWLSRKTIRRCNPVEEANDDQPLSKPWSSEPPNG